MKVKFVAVNGLFGSFQHRVEFRQEEPTLLLAPNGAGKTHILKLTAAALSLDVGVLLDTQFESLTVGFKSGKNLHFKRTNIEPNGPIIQVWLSSGSESGSVLTLSEEDTTFPEERTLALRRVTSEGWTRDDSGRIYSLKESRRRFGSKTAKVRKKLSGFPEINRYIGNPNPIFIDTWRLDSRVEDNEFLGGWGKSPSRDRSAAESRIKTYTENLRDEISDARRASVSVTQSADASFATRALAIAKSTVKEGRLHEQYNNTVARYEALTRNGLAVGEAPIPFPESTTPTVRRILQVFLDDWEKRLEPLLPVNDKLQLLREILDSKLAPSGKKTSVSSSGGLEFVSHNGRRIAVGRLSSGEQHLVALFTLLLFAAQPESLVLIDEPEISLHAAWKHAFLEDISRVAEINNLQIVLATHSASIVNGRWDLAEELELPPLLDENDFVEVIDDEEEIDD